MAPSQTDTEILNYWSNMINQAFSDPQVQQRLGALYLDLAPSTPEQTQAYLQKEHEAWGEVIQRAAISID